ncbi:MAG: hypothetical protein RLZZ293_761, partial [Pseudomonadota bacterium]
MRVLHISSELYPLLKTGGLADVVSALPLALNQFNCESRILLPAFPALWDKGLNKQLIRSEER